MSADAQVRIEPDETALLLVSTTPVFGQGAAPAVVPAGGDQMAARW
jgi:hypothetical protein